jgi:hypothetical protein
MAMDDKQEIKALTAMNNINRIKLLEMESILCQWALEVKELENMGVINFIAWKNKRKRQRAP